MAVLWATLGAVSRRAPTILITSLAAALVAVAVWLSGRTVGTDAPPVDFPPEAGGVVETSPGPAPAADVSSLMVTVHVEPRAVLLPPLESLPPPCRLVGPDGQEIPAGVTILAGARAAVPTSGAGGRHLVAFAEPGHTAMCRVVDLQRDGVVEVLAGGRIPLHGLVRDAQGAPLPGAWVWAGQLGADGAPLAVTTDASGQFGFPWVLGGTGVPLVVRAGGHASRYRVLDLMAFDADGIDVVLDEAVALDVVLGAAVPDPALGRIGLAPAAGDAALLHYPFFLSALLGQDALARDGTARIADLPAGAAVEVSIAHPALRDAPPVTVPLRRAEQRAVVQGAVAPMLVGTVRGRDGAPVAGAVLRAWTGSADALLRPRHPRLLLSAVAHAPAGTRTTADAGGRFAIGRPGADGGCKVAVRAPGRTGVLQQVAPARGPVEHDFVLPAAVPFAPPAVVRVRLRPAGRILRIRHAGARFVRWHDHEPFEVRLAEPALVEVRVVAVDGGEVVERRFENLPVAGIVDVEVDV